MENTLNEVVEVVEVIETIDTENLELLITETNQLLINIHNLLITQNEILGHIYAALLYGFALLAPAFVCVLLYRFFKKFM